MDTIIVHGGLGTTAEALRVGVPVIITGVLLMDQRFWGKRVNDLGVGPEPTHISSFSSVSTRVIFFCCLVGPGSFFGIARNRVDVSLKRYRCQFAYFGRSALST